MPELNDNQVALLREKLLAAGLTHAPLLEELLDHACCTVEAEMARGADFPAALATATTIFKENEIKEMQAFDLQLLNQQQLIMNRLSLLFLGILLMLTTLTFAGPPDPPAIAPLRGSLNITGTFGEHLHPIQKVKRMHQGVDFKALLGTPVVATAAGTVTWVEYDADGYGHFIVIRHDERYETRYAQLSETRVKAGQEVAQGEVIALVGNSGRSTGPHLHYEVRKDGKLEDPMAYLAQ